MTYCPCDVLGEHSVYEHFVYTYIEQSGLPEREEVLSLSKVFLLQRFKWLLKGVV